MSRRTEALDRGRLSYAERAWSDAYEAFSRADHEEPLGLEDLEKLAWSAGLMARDDDLLRLMERLYRAHAEAERCEQAARWAFWLGFRLLSLGEAARANGWLVRAQRFVERGGRPCVIEGYLLLPVSVRMLVAGDLEGAKEAAERAVAIGEQFRDVDLLACARCFLGKVLLRQADIERGLALLDETMLAATSGELSPLVTGLVYCNAIASCHRVYALDRAREWTTALSAWCEAQPQLVNFTGSCLVHRAEILQLGGAWPEAVEHARRASERSTADSEASAAALYQQAEVSRLQGELEVAEELYRKASQRGFEPQPGLALLRLQQGKGAAAVTAIRRVMGASEDPLARARFLPAAVEILLRTGELEQARAASAELRSIAERFDTEVLGALAAHAEGSVLLAEGEAQAALSPLRRAFEVWQRIGAPYLAARIRVELAAACRALGDEDAAALELEAAREVFQQLGAVDFGAAVAVEKKTRPAHGLTVREIEVLRLVASGKTNKAIAEELCLSEKTIDRHVSNIFAKVSVASRAAATAYAYENGLV